MATRSSKSKASKSTAPSIPQEPIEAIATLTERAVKFGAIALEQLHESDTNPRRHFDDAQLAELAASIRRHGVLQPILVRPSKRGGELFEVIAGARRFRASKLAELAEIPARVVELDDRETLEVQIIENLARADLSPLEEALGYRQLRDAHGYTVEQIAAKLHRSKGYVYGRMKLAELPDKVREAIDKGKLDHAVALVIARIPDAGVQEKAAKAVMSGGWNGEQMTYRAAVDLVWRRFMLRLADAPFDPKDAALVPDAGACTVCPFRTGNQSDLFGQLGADDMCTRVACYEGKREARKTALLAEAKAGGVEVIQVKESWRANDRFVSDKGVRSAGLAPVNVQGGDSTTTWEKALGKRELAKVAKCVLVAGDAVETGYSVKALQAAAAAKGLKLRKHAERVTTAEDKARAERRKIGKACMPAVIETVRVAIRDRFRGAKPTEVLGMLAQLAGLTMRDEVEETFGVAAGAAMLDAAQTGEAKLEESAAAVAVAMVCTLRPLSPWRFELEEEAVIAAKVVGADLRKLFEAGKRAVEHDAKVAKAAKGKRAPKATAAPEAKATPRAKPAAKAKPKRKAKATGRKGAK